jgi:ubiquinone/menaquinone biosynthesis C-methylase UbiE
VIGFAGVEPGTRAIDVGCGSGALTTALARRLGAASVCAADPSEPFAEACQARLPGVEVVVAGAEALPFADGLFHGALSQLVVNFMRDPAAGLREMARVTRPGGVVACVPSSGEHFASDRSAGAEARRQRHPERQIHAATHHSRLGPQDLLEHPVGPFRRPLEV